MNTHNYKELVPGENASFNAGWESFFIGRELSDNPNTDATEYHKDWAKGFAAAQASRTD